MFLSLPAQTDLWAQLPRAERPEDVGLSSQRLNRLAAALDEQAEEGRLAGGVARVARRGQVAYLRPFGDRDRDEPIGETISRMARLPIDAQPGERWVYGYSADILGPITD